jgi:hypothetical protein
VLVSDFFPKRNCESHVANRLKKLSKFCHVHRLFTFEVICAVHTFKDVP